MFSRCFHVCCFSSLCFVSAALPLVFTLLGHSGPTHVLDCSDFDSGATCAIRMRDLVVTILCHLTRWEVGLGAVPLSPAAPCVGLGAVPLSPAAPCGARLDGATTRGRQEHQKPRNNSNWHDYYNHLQSSAPGLRGGKAEAATDDANAACISLNHPYHKPIDSIDDLHYLWWPP